MMLGRFALLNRCSALWRNSRPLCTSVYTSKFAPTERRWSTENYKSEILEPRLNNPQPITKTEWKSIRADLMSKVGRLNDKNVDGWIMSVCRSYANSRTMQNSMAYIDMMKDANIALNLAIRNNLLLIYHKKSEIEPLSQNEMQEIKDIYAQIRGEYGNVLNSSTIEAAAMALSHTDKWRHGWELITKYRSIVQVISITAVCPLIQRAFLEGDCRLGIQMLGHLLSKTDKNIIPSKVFMAYWEFCRRQPNNQRQHIETMLELIQKERVVVTKQTIFGLKALLKELNVTLNNTEVQANGICLNCKGSLQHTEVSDQEYTELRKQFLEKVLIRGNVYMQSTPEEMGHFLDFIGKQQSFDWVLDGLNIGHKLDKGCAKVTPEEQSHTVATVVKSFADKGQRVLLFGRKHMHRWRHWNFIKTNCSYFLVDNHSKDDTFILYGALASGVRCKFISADMMRDHAHLLGPEVKAAFQRWQQKHQYNISSVAKDGYFTVQPGVQFDIHGHKHMGVWHIPFVNDDQTILPDLYAYNMPPMWACFKL